MVPNVGPHSATPARLFRRPPVWLPWLAAPAFLLLPIGGCGAAASLLRPQPFTAPHPATRADAPRLVPVATMVPTRPGPR